MQGTYLGGVSIIVPNYDAAIAFFCAIGFDVTANVNLGHKRWVTVRPSAGGPELVFAKAEGKAQIEAIGAQGAGRVWLFLYSDNFDHDAAQIVAAGGAFEEQPRVEPYGRVAVWRDPWGNRWDLIAPFCTQPQ